MRLHLRSTYHYGAATTEFTVTNVFSFFALIFNLGDTPLPGAGTYASKFVASSATGTGEYVIRALACRQISDNVEKGMSLRASIDAVLEGMGRDFDADVGFIGIDANGNAVGAHRTPHMPHAWFSGSSEIVAKMRS